MKAYPIILIPCDNGVYSVDIPDFNSATEGKDLADAIYMARDAIGLCGICEQDEGRDIPEPGTSSYTLEPGQFVNYVDIDFDAYRKEVDTTAERVSVTVPRNLRAKAKAAGLNLSQELQARLREVLSMV